MTTDRKENGSTAASRDVEWVMVCLPCWIYQAGFATAGAPEVWDAAEAAYFASVHNDLHHGGRPEAFACPLTDEPVGDETGDDTGSSTDGSTVRSPW